MQNGLLEQQRKESRKKKLVAILTSWQLYLLILPAVVYIFIFNYMPMYGIIIAFKDYRASKGMSCRYLFIFEEFAKFFDCVTTLHIS